jgi:hypothetical protein
VLGRLYVARGPDVAQAWLRDFINNAATKRKIIISAFKGMYYKIS